MSRPLIISDCDEVLLYMVSPFRDWLAETQGVEFRMEGNDFAKALRWQESGEFSPRKRSGRSWAGSSIPKGTARRRFPARSRGWAHCARTPMW